MASSEYTHGEMKIDAQSKMYDGFMKASAWGALILLISVGYMVFTLSMGINWLVSLVLCAGAGIAIGMIMGMGGAWISSPFPRWYAQPKLKMIGIIFQD